MNIRCANCGHAALDTDSSCWHCGEPLPGREQAGHKKVRASESWTHGTGSQSVAVFAGLTLLVIVGAVLVMASLGRQPQLQVRLGARAQSGWKFLTDANRIYTISLPDDWQWVDGADPTTTTDLQRMIDSQPALRLATHPLGAEVDDMSILFVASSQLPFDSQAPFLIVASSPSLNRLSYQDAQTFLARSDYLIQEVSFVDDFDKSHLSIIVDTPLEVTGQQDETGRILRCRQQFVLGRQQSLLVSLCVPPRRVNALATLIDEIMASFQHLDT